MIKLEDAQKKKEIYDLAVLPETSLRLEAAYYELMDEVLEKCPSANVRDWFSAPVIQTSVYHDVDGVDGYQSSVYTEFSMEADFDEVMNHACDVDTKTVIAIFRKEYVRRGIYVYAKITVTAPLDPDYLQTMKDLGKIKINPASSYPASESVFCPTGSSDNIPF